MPLLLRESGMEQMAPAETAKNSSLMRLFSGTLVQELASRRNSPLFAKVVHESGLFRALDPIMPLRDLFEVVFRTLRRDFRAEYVYKNAIANKLLIGRHSLSSSFMLTEFRCGDCRADSVLLNGTSNVYEVKSEFDSTRRLRRQLSEYSKLFDNVYVVTSPEKVTCLREQVDETIGLMVLSRRHTISTIRRPTSGKHQVRPGVIFDSLRKSEYTRIVAEEYGLVPDVPNTRLYEECKGLFCKLSPESAHNTMLRALKRRGDSGSHREFIGCVPPSLRAAAVACKLSKTAQQSFLRMLDRPVLEALEN